jgi:ATPase subunit of ABC transporter with duplicated ATPase domains
MSSIVIGRGISYELPNGRELFKDLNFSLDGRLSALVGANGIGKSCLANLIAGQLEPSDGAIRRTGSVKLLPQRQEPKRITVTEFLCADYRWSLLGERLLATIDRQALCTALSGGQWMRVRLAHALADDFLVLDEPTNDLDRDGREAVMQFLRERDGGALLISHDRECLQLSEELFELSNRGLARFGGGWAPYTEAKQRERERARAALELAKRERDASLADRADVRARQEKRNRSSSESAARGGMPKILLGARKRRAQATSGKLDAMAITRSKSAVREAHAAFSKLKMEPLMYADLIGREIPAQKLVAEAHGFNVRFQEWIYRDDLDFTWHGNVRIA